MKREKIVLGIESSCDETAAAVVSWKGDVLSNQIYSQIKQHQKFGGVVPEIAARTHLEKIEPIITSALKVANVQLCDLFAIAGTAGPGLIGGVNVGMGVAKGLAFALGVPFVAVNHLAAHALSARLTNNIEFPFLLLLISGGHTQLLIVKSAIKYELLGESLDDAVGEAFDKTAKILNVGYPGGVQIERLAKLGDDKRYKLPTPLFGKRGCDFSFSGLKSSARRHIEQARCLTDNDNKTMVQDMAASFQRAVVVTLKNRVENAMDIFKCKIHKGSQTSHNFVIAGGVAANGLIRESLSDLALDKGFDFFVAPKHLCTDNGAMVGWAGIENLKSRVVDDLTVEARPRWSLDG